uniref:Uncharacterized protein n=1 Tax=viral metagenome TaxID=1070528 RepID=A0A6C0C0N7_9ZZZZ
MLSNKKTVVAPPAISLPPESLYRSPPSDHPPTKRKKTERASQISVFPSKEAKVGAPLSSAEPVTAAPPVSSLGRKRKEKPPSVLPQAVISENVAQEAEKGAPDPAVPPVPPLPPLPLQTVAMPSLETSRLSTTPSKESGSNAGIEGKDTKDSVETLGLHCISQLISLHYTNKSDGGHTPPSDPAYAQKLLALVNKLIGESQWRADKNNRKVPAPRDL